MKTFRIQGMCLGLLLAGLLHAGSALAAETPISDKARAHFEAGVSLLQDPDGARYEEAFSEFRAAYSDSPSWKILGNLGITAMKLERDGEAIEAFKGYLAGGGAAIDPGEKAQMQRDLATLTAGVVTVEVSSLPAGAFVIDERIAVQGPPIKNSYGPLTDKLKLGVRSGSHRFTAHLDGYQDQVWMVDGQPGGALQHQFELKQAAAAPITETAPGTPPPASRTLVKERPVPTGVYIGLAATGVLAVGTGVVGGLALSKHSDFQSKNDGSDPSAAQSLKDSGKTLNLVTDVLLGGAVVAGAVTAVLYFSRPSTTVDQGSFRVTPVAGPRLAGLSLAGSF
jgi:hypothetical protein